MRASHSFDTRLGDAGKRWWRAYSNQVACNSTDLALALGARLLTCEFDFQRSVAGDRSSHQFSASPTFPCKNQAATDPILVVLGDLLGAWREPDAKSPRRSLIWRRPMNMNLIDVGVMSHGAKAAVQCQKEYFNTNIIKSFEWRLEQLDRLSRMLSENMNAFSEAVGSDFKTAQSEKAFEVAALQSPHLLQETPAYSRCPRRLRRRMAAAFVALHDPVYTGQASVPCRLKAWGFLIPYRGL